MSTFDELVLGTLPHVPRPVMWRLAKRYVAGETLESAVDKLRELAARGHPGIIDVLGEEVTDEAHARRVVDEYRQAADAVVAARLDAYVSVKPTHVGLRTSEAVAHELYSVLARHCKQRGLFLRVEMEDNTTTDATLRVFELLRREFDNVGIVLQARLLRTPDDIRRLAPGPLHVRMVKGIYLEPAEIAHTQPQPIRDAYIECVRRLLARGAFVSLATHDADMADSLIELVRQHGLARTQYEFQVLLGVQEGLWERWSKGGHTVRVYVPFGPEWLPYSLRRLRKNPEMLRHLMRATLGLGKQS
jgi:proline dehydrogenase